MLGGEGGKLTAHRRERHDLQQSAGPGAEDGWKRHNVREKNRREQAPDIPQRFSDPRRSYAQDIAKGARSAGYPSGKTKSGSRKAMLAKTAKRYALCQDLTSRSEC
eukprot:1470549-Rhodomonas_salina.1